MLSFGVLTDVVMRVVNILVDGGLHWVAIDLIWGYFYKMETPGIFRKYGW